MSGPENQPRPSREGTNREEKPEMGRDQETRKQ